ncbi:hypothetical protein KKF25_03125 [Patescibacteria group bacterium]|nr:hypothetical protein [Patescibacteria group bacterium]
MSENSNEPSVKNLRAVVGPRPSGRGVVDSKFSEASFIFSKFYRRAAVFSTAFLPPKKRQKHYL